MGVRRLNKMIAAEPRVMATEIQTVGSKGYDGFAIAMVLPTAKGKSRARIFELWPYGLDLALSIQSGMSCSSSRDGLDAKVFQ